MGVINSSLLSDHDLYTELESEIESDFEINSNCGVQHRFLWDAVKVVILWGVRNHVSGPGL